MAQLTCPYCNEIALSSSRKSWLGPAVSVTCNNYGKRIGVEPGKSWIVIITVSVLFLISTNVISSLLVRVLICLAVAYALNLNWVPIITKEGD